MKKFKIGVISLLTVLVIAIIGVLTVHTSTTDRLNPLVSETDTQNYKQVTIINPKDGKTRAYKIKQVGGYDPNQEYIKIHHKGQYVKSISYITKNQFYNQQ